MSMNGTVNGRNGHSSTGDHAASFHVVSYGIYISRVASPRLCLYCFQHGTACHVADEVTQRGRFIR